MGANFTDVDWAGYGLAPREPRPAGCFRAKKRREGLDAARRSACGTISSTSPLVASSEIRYTSPCRSGTKAGEPLSQAANWLYARTVAEGSPTTPERYPILVTGLLLSGIMIVPSIRMTPFGRFSIVYHSMLLAALSLPFWITYFLSRNRSWTIPAVTLGVLFSLCHAYLIYVSYAYPPQEFGYAGLLFAPLVEAVVVIPIAMVVIYIIKRLR